MTKPANKRRGEVALDKAGEGIFLRFTVDAMERLHSEYGEDYLEDLLKGVQKVNVRMIKLVLECTIDAPEGKFDIQEMPFGYTWNELVILILDMIYLSLHGRTAKEQNEHLEEEYLKKFEELKSDPKKAVALLSKQSLTLDSEQDYGQTKSEVTQSET